MNDPSAALPPELSLFVPISRLPERAIDWLWPARLSLGNLSLFEGDPERGKSLIELDLAARLSTGRPFPDGKPGLPPGNVLVLNAEDDEATVIRPRLRALGADPDRVIVWDKARCASGGGVLRLPSQVNLLEQAAGVYRPLLVVIDPITAFLDSNIYVNSDQSIRRALAPLATIAERVRFATVLSCHLNKKVGQRSIYRASGSMALVGACRSAWLFAPDPGQAGRCVIAQVKNNLAPPQPSLTYEIQAGPDELPAILWAGESALKADDLVVRPAHRWATPARDRATEFLLTCLASGPRTSREIWPLARAEGLARETLKRAKDNLGIRIQCVTTQGKVDYWWLLPDQQVPGSVAPEDDECSLEPWLAPLRAMYPPATPLDDL